METIFKLTKIGEVYSINAKTVVCNVTYKVTINDSFSTPMVTAIEDIVRKILKKYHKCDKNLIINLTSSATCSEKDDWDESVGKRIAHSKNELTAYKIMGNVNAKLSDFLANLCLMSVNTGDRFSNIRDKEVLYQANLGKIC